MYDVFNGLGFECFINPRQFNLIKEELSRIGFAGKNKTLTQTAHIFQKRKKYGIFHFKELFIFDGKEADIHPDDIERRNIIIGYLLTKDLISIENDREFLKNYVDVSIFGFYDYNFFIDLGKGLGLTFLPKCQVVSEEWKFITKYTFGNKFNSHYTLEL